MQMEGKRGRPRTEATVIATQAVMESVMWQNTATWLDCSVLCSRTWLAYIVHKTFSNFAEVGVTCKTMYICTCMYPHTHTYVGSRNNCQAFQACRTMHIYTHIWNYNCLTLQPYPCSPKQEFSKYVPGIVRMHNSQMVSTPTIWTVWCRHEAMHSRC